MQTAEKCGYSTNSDTDFRCGSPRLFTRLASVGAFIPAHDNVFTVELIDAEGERVEYVVYFKLSRAPRKGRLNLHVQSAYAQDDTLQARPRPRKPIRFSVIAYNVTVGKVIRVPK